MSKRIFIRPSICISLCIGLFILPIPWVLAWFAAVLIHESGHLLAMKIMNVPIQRITLGLKGAMIETGYLSAGTELFCALAGPLAGLGCLLVSRHFPLLAICALLQSVYNLLPFPDYDGGRILMLILCRLLSLQQAETVYRWLLLTVSVLILLLGLYLWCILKLGPMFFLLGVIPVAKSGVIKIPCKQSKQIVQ